MMLGFIAKIFSQILLIIKKKNINIIFLICKEN